MSENEEPTFDRRYAIVAGVVAGFAGAVALNGEDQRRRMQRDKDFKVTVETLQKAMQQQPCVELIVAPSEVGQEVERKEEVAVTPRPAKTRCVVPREFMELNKAHKLTDSAAVARVFGLTPPKVDLKNPDTLIGCYQKNNGLQLMDVRTLPEVARELSHIIETATEQHPVPAQRGGGGLAP